jgi:hypothetical protein
LERGPLAVKGKKDSDRAAANLSVLNADEKPGPLRLTFQAASSGKVRLAGYKPRIAEPGATRVTVTFAGFKKLESEPVEGQLVAEGRERPVARAVSITPALQPFRDWASCILWVAVVAAGALAPAGQLVGNRKLVETRRRPEVELRKLGHGPSPPPADSSARSSARRSCRNPRKIDKDTSIRLNRRRWRFWVGSWPARKLGQGRGVGRWRRRAPGCVLPGRHDGSPGDDGLEGRCGART